MRHLGAAALRDLLKLGIPEDLQDSIDREVGEPI